MPKTKNVTLRLHPQVDTDLNDLADLMNTSRADAIRIALTLLKRSADAIRSGSTVAFIPNDRRSTNRPKRVVIPAIESSTAARDLITLL